MTFNAHTRYLKSVDRHNEWTVSAFLASNGECLTDECYGCVKDVARE